MCKLCNKPNRRPIESRTISQQYIIDFVFTVQQYTGELPCSYCIDTYYSGHKKDKSLDSYIIDKLKRSHAKHLTVKERKLAETRTNSILRPKRISKRIEKLITKVYDIATDKTTYRYMSHKYGSKVFKTLKEARKYRERMENGRI